MLNDWYFLFFTLQLFNNLKLQNAKFKGNFKNMWKKQVVKKNEYITILATVYRPVMEK